MAAYFLKVKGRPGHSDGEREAARGQGPNSNGFPTAVGLQPKKRGWMDH